MDIKTTKNDRLFFEQLGDTETVGKGRAKGINRHSSLPGLVLSLIGLSFKDSDHGFINKKSTVHYLQRNVDNENLSNEEKDKIRNLSENSTAKEVKDLFNSIKGSGDKEAVFPKSLTIIGRYDRANEMNPKTIVRLMDDKTAYAANKVRINEGNFYIVAESPKGGDAIYVDKNWDEIGREKSEDKKYYYEMVWAESCPTLVSAADVYNNGALDKERFDFLAEGEEAEFEMTSGDKLFVKCVSANKDNPSFEIRTLELTVGNETRLTEQWILKGAFGYDNEGLQHAKTLYEQLVKEKKSNPDEVQLIVNCNTGKDRSAALIMWISLFEMLDEKSITVEEITHTYLKEIAKEFESQSVKGGLIDNITNTLPKYYPTDEALQEALRQTLSASK